MPAIRHYSQALSLIFLILLSSCSPKDAALEQSLIGSWDYSFADGKSIELGLNIRKDHTYLLTSGPSTAQIQVEGRWNVKEGTLLMRAQNWSEGGPVPREISQDDSVILEAKAEEIVLRNLGGGLAILRRKSLSDANESASTQKNTTIEERRVATAPRVQPSPPPPQPVKRAPPKAFIDETLYIPTERHSSLTFQIYRKANVYMIVDIDNQAPVDIIMLPFSATGAEYDNLKINIGLGQAVDLMSQLFGKAETERYMGKSSGITEATLFEMTMSKKAAYVHHEARAQLDPGHYTIFFDNSGDFTPTRGDAPLRVQLFAVE